MKISLNWLKDFIKITLPPEKLAAKFTMAMAEVEHVDNLAKSFDHVVVGKIITIAPHPQADKLRVVEVNIGDRRITVVCGAANIYVGMLVAVALPGAKVKWHGQGDWVTLEAATIRGVKSAGMISAASELGLPASLSPDGVIDLKTSPAKPGQPLAKALGFNDVIFTIDNKSLTHRSDLFGHLGIAREIAAILGRPFKAPKLAKPKLNAPKKNFKIFNHAPKYCQRYSAIIMDGVKVVESPAWLKARLLAVGVRPINNIVDITNYVMMEYGQPLHAFDYDKLSGQEIHVRRAALNERLVTLDGVERRLTDKMFVIADAQKPVALGGVIGGQATEITHQTKTIVIESARFDPVIIRRMALSLGLRTEGSTRFEKGLDQNLASSGLARAVELTADLADAKVASPIYDLWPVKTPGHHINLRLDKVGRIMGVPLPLTRVKKTLTHLGCQVKSAAEPKNFWSPWAIPKFIITLFTEKKWPRRRLMISLNIASF